MKCAKLAQISQVKASAKAVNCLISKSRSGGSAALKIPRKSRTPVNEKGKQENALQRAKERIGGEAKYLALINAWEELNRGQVLAGQVFEAADGFIASLISQNYSNREIRALLGIGGHRLCRV